jgi:hypothetical protein
MNGLVEEKSRNRSYARNVRVPSGTRRENERNIALKNVVKWEKNKKV